jgi:hypothetical protein
MSETAHSGGDEARDDEALSERIVTRLRTDPEARRGFETWAKTDYESAAVARVFLALTDGEEPNPEDVRALLPDPEQENGGDST